MSARQRVRRSGGIRPAVPFLLPFFTVLFFSFGDTRYRHLPEDLVPDAPRIPGIRQDLPSCRAAVPFLPALKSPVAPVAVPPLHEVFREGYPVFEVADIAESEGEEHVLSGLQGIGTGPDDFRESPGRLRRLMVADARKTVRLCLRSSGVTPRPPPPGERADLAG